VDSSYWALGWIGVLVCVSGGLLALATIAGRGPGLDGLILGVAGFCVGGIVADRCFRAAPKKKQCHACREWMQPEATRCPHCTEVVR